MWTNTQGSFIINILTRHRKFCTDAAKNLKIYTLSLHIAIINIIPQKDA